jgi:hypothetical protein
VSGKTGLRSSRAGQFPNSQPPTHPSSLALLLISIRQIPTVACPQSPPSEPPNPSSLSLETQQPVPTLAQPRLQRQRAEASLGGDHPTPSRTARKPHLPRASSARVGSLPRSPTQTSHPSPAACPRPQQPVPTPAQPKQQRQRAEASLGGDHPTPSRTARKPHLPPSLFSALRLVAAEPNPNKPPIPSSLSPSPAACPYPRPTEAAAATSRSEPWRRSPNPIAHSAKAPPPPSLLSARRLDAADPPKQATQPQQPVPRTPSNSLSPKHPTAPPATNWRPQLNAGFLDARERVRFPQSFGTNPEHVHEQHR